MASNYSTHQGSSALSDFRRKALLAQLKARNIVAHYVYYIDLTAPLEESQRGSIAYLLVCDGGNSEPAHDGKGKAYIFYVFPRTGTISPWSSKATSIAHVCGLRNKVRRIERGVVYKIFTNEHIVEDMPKWSKIFYDRMTQELSPDKPGLDGMFAQSEGETATIISIFDQVEPRKALEVANKNLGLALDPSEIFYLIDACGAYGNEPLRRDLYLVELFTFAQINSEHCRHKQFKALGTTIDGGLPNVLSLFGMIRNTYRQHPEGIISAYTDNAAVMEGPKGSYLAPTQVTGLWTQTETNVPYLAKVETHNHPTAVSPFAGAATGSGGEIRDEGAVGRGSEPKAALCGFAVSDLNIPGFKQEWEIDIGRPEHIASGLQILLEGPIGSAGYNNEFGRPCITGFFRTLTISIPIGNGEFEIRGYHKPMMVAGGVGSVRPELALKDPDLVKAGTHLIILGGPAMRIGLGGGAASSIASHEDNVELAFASVQRGNAEVQIKAQEVINTCSAMGTSSPILFIHDVGAGGLSVAVPELVHDCKLGATIELRDIHRADSSMDPLEIWCSEAQERYVLAVAEEGLDLFKKFAERERCEYSVIGKTTAADSDGETRIIVKDRDSAEHPTIIDRPMSFFFSYVPPSGKAIHSRLLHLSAFDSSLAQYLPNTPKDGLLSTAIHRVLALPSVGSKSFLITIGDRSVKGIVARDQMVGPWQTPVADVGVIATSLTQGIRTGVAMATGENAKLALISPAASSRMAVAESIMNLAAAALLGRTEGIRLSANWMCASGHPGEDAALHEAVKAIGMDLCPKLGITIPVGKDSMSMQMKWTDKETKEAKEVTAPLSVVITAFAEVRDIRKTWTPTLRRLEDVGETVILLVDLAKGRQALGGSALAQVFGQIGHVAPDVHDIQLLRDYFDALEQLQDMEIVLAYHDRSDGGLFTTLVEMMFAGRCGLEIMIDSLSSSKSTNAIMEALFNEELGAVFQVRKRDEIEFNRAFATCGPPTGLIKKIGRVPASSKQELSIYHHDSPVYRATRIQLQNRWSATSHQIQRLRDNPSCADEERSNILDSNNPGLSYNLSFSAKDSILPSISTLMSSLSLRSKPRVAILREEGSNGQQEMAFAFDSAGFDAIDVHMTDLFSGRRSLESFVGLAAVGGFSYGDVLGAGQGWAKSVLLNEKVRTQFQNFFERKDTFSLGVCNGCQFLTLLKSLIPGADAWPVFERNVSEQYEARVCMVELLDSPPQAAAGAQSSVFLHGMSGSTLPIAVAHGEGRASFQGTDHPQKLLDAGLVAVRYVDNYLQPTEAYPANPNGSPLGIAGVRSKDGRVLALMPHPERTVLAGVGSYIPDHVREEWSAKGPWSRLFESARRWVG